jgi:hypothetical protein
VTLKSTQRSGDGLSNIGPREIMKRRILGVAALCAGAALAFGLFAMGAPRLYRLTIFFPIWIAALGLFQARERTCVALAGKGVCNLDAGEVEIIDRALDKRLRQKAKQINKRALIAAATVTLVAVAFPAATVR